MLRDLREVHLGDWERGEYRIALAERDPIALQALTRGALGRDPRRREQRGPRRARRRSASTRCWPRLAPGARAAAVLHGGVIGELCRQVTGSRPFAFIHADNGSFSRLVAFATGHRLLRNFNDTAHLG